MGPSLNGAGSFRGENGLSNRSVHGLTYGLSPLALIHAAILIFFLFPPLNRPMPRLSFAEIRPRFPARGLFPAAVVHAAILFFFLYPPLFTSLIPPRIIEVRWDDPHPAPHDSVVMTKLYYSAKMASEPAPAAIPSAQKPSEPSSPRVRGNILTPPGQLEKTAIAQSIYSGPQEVVSISPHSTNSIQTLLRPDLVNPPTLKCPQLLKSVVILPLRVAAASETRPANLVALTASAQPNKNVPVELHVAKVADKASVPALDTQRQPPPEIESEVPKTGPLAAIVLNAVTVPENAPVALPDAELSGSFAVRSVHSVQSTVGEGASGESAKTSDATKPPSEIAKEKGAEAVVLSSEMPPRKGSDGSNTTGITSEGNGAGKSNSNRPSQVIGTSQVADTGVRSQVAHGVPGIIIIGGTSRDGSRVGVSSTTPATYGLTVISSGTSGGASRDLGIFERREIVYTVYIPMADVGGGPDWSIQYGILEPTQAGSGLLTPPVAVKKVRAVVTGHFPNASPTIIFSGVISATGELTVKLPFQMDARTRQALDALRQWEFLPAQLNGIAVAIKVLVGVGTVSE